MIGSVRMRNTYDTQPFQIRRVNEVIRRTAQCNCCIGHPQPDSALGSPRVGAGLAQPVTFSHARVRHGVPFVLAARRITAPTPWRDTLLIGPAQTTGFSVMVQSCR